jgi:plastocyanin
MFRARPIPVVALAAVALAACGSDGGGSSSSDTVPKDALLVVAEDGLQWESDSYAATVVDGQITIAGRNESSLFHDLYVISAEGEKSANFLEMTTGQTVVDDFRVQPGSYQIVCLVPGHNNMKADLTVT